MSSSSSDPESPYNSDGADVRDYSDYEGEVEPSTEDDDVSTQSDATYSRLSSTDSSDEEGALCADDPVADAEWTARYEEEMREITAQEKIMKDRLDGVVEMSEWCNCGNCVRELLQNISECCCCRELEVCVEAMESEEVLQDFPPGTKLACVTEHPGFNPVCLQKWSLKQAAWKYKTKGNKRYKQVGSEERYFRSVSYREFSRMVYGVLGTKRIPLPACAYTAIRKQFPVMKDDEYTGFETDDDDES